MTLISVRSFGTEGRRSGNQEIVGNDNEIAEVLFKVELIKDFKILEKPNPILLDPAIISSKAVSDPAPAKKPVEAQPEEAKRQTN